LRERMSHTPLMIIMTTIMILSGGCGIFDSDDKEDDSCDCIGLAGTPIKQLTFSHDSMYDNLFGGVVPRDVLSNNTVYTSGSTTDPILFRNPDLSGEIAGASLVVDITHSSGDPSQIETVTYTRDFVSPLSAPGNTGSLTFQGFYPTAGAATGVSSTPIASGVSRWYMAFSVEAFHGNGGYNIPAAGEVRAYTVTITAADTDNNTSKLTRTVTIISPVL